ncbi:hypothetical protein [Methylibium rhizosphaerae]|uniref:hypothetical protein n=1 Tax=Methylibium rhizosphaerae TaxID=2570323 RepID=UPI0011269786|nr:hypothetical protein [Methylibium rhizosphaerae]
MTHARTPQPPRQVPTLTEVVDVGKSKPAAGAVAPAAAATPPPPVAPTPAVPAPPVLSPAGVTSSSLNEAALVQRVLFDVQRQVDLMLEHRLRETLEPALARLTESLVREVHNDLASTLRDVVAKAVAQEIARLRAR